MSDYTDIQQELDDFENAVYGEEVRDSMVSAIKKIHDIAESTADAPDATTATAGQAPIADGQGGWQWGDVATSGDSVPTNVRQAISTLLQAAAYTETGLTDEIAVVQAWASSVTAITVSPSTASISGSGTTQLSAVTTPSGGAVTWTSSDTSVATVSSSGLVTSVSNGTVTITATSGNASATCTVTVSGFATLTGISAVYTQSGTVYATDSLSDLTNDLVVTASYDDSTTATLTSSQYTLSGTLAVGTSTITVSYGGYSDTFNVTVSAIPVNYIYNWDFTTSLTDTVAGNVATLNHSATQTTNGITFTTINDYVSFGTNLVPSSSFSRTVEVDVFELNKQSGSNARVFTNNFGEGLVYKGANGEWGLYSGTGGWTMLGITDANYFSGKTVSFELSNGSFTVSCDGATLGSISIADYRFTLGSSVTSYYNMTISGLRVY